MTHWSTTLRRRWLLVICAAIVGATAAGVSEAVRGDQYEASALLTVVSEDAGSETLVASYAQTFARLAVRSSVIGPAMRDAGFVELAVAPEDAITARVPPDAPLVEISARSSEPERAAAIANAAVKGVGDYTARTAARTGLRAEVLVAATAPVEPAGIGLALTVVIGALVGGIAGTVLALALPPAW